VKIVQQFIAVLNRMGNHPFLLYSYFFNSKAGSFNEQPWGCFNSVLVSLLML
jgi:hypothetical protein